MINISIFNSWEKQKREDNSMDTRERHLRRRRLLIYHNWVIGHKFSCCPYFVDVAMKSCGYNSRKSQYEWRRCLVKIALRSCKNCNFILWSYCGKLVDELTGVCVGGCPSRCPMKPQEGHSRDDTRSLTHKRHLAKFNKYATLRFDVSTCSFVLRWQRE